MKHILLIAALSAALVGCRDSEVTATRAEAEQHGHSHFDGPPHGGTPVQIGDHGFHLELVLDPTVGKMQAYVLDGHMEHYVSVPEKTFSLSAKVGEKTETLSFARVPDPQKPSSETSSTFEANAEWLKSVTAFEGTIPEITLKGKSFTNITFSFPKGSGHKH